MQTLETIVTLLSKSLQPTTAKAAEAELRKAEEAAEFGPCLLRLIASNELETPIRLSASLYLKNYISRKWENDLGESFVSDIDSTEIKRTVVDVMAASPSQIQNQLSETIKIIADTDFPAKWETLIDELVEKLDTDDCRQINGVLQTSHAIFRRWRPLFRTDDLFREVKFVLERFCVPYLKTFEKTHYNLSEARELNTASEEWYEILLLECKLFYDLNCQDIPEFFEDNLDSFMTVFQHYLLLQCSEDDLNTDTPSVIETIKGSICQILQLYAQRYMEVFSSFYTFVQIVTELVASADTRPKYDALIVQGMEFLSSAFKIAKDDGKLSSDKSLQKIVETIVIPNMQYRASDIELLDEDPAEFIRRDIEGSDSNTRMRASIELLNSLAETYQQRISNLIISYTQKLMADFERTGSFEWNLKDMTYHLLTSVSIRSATARKGVISTNLAIDVSSFFENFVLSDLKSQNAHAILKIDAIRFVELFRNQLSTQQLSNSLGYLVTHLQSSNFVVHTYAAICISKLCFEAPDANKLIPTTISLNFSTSIAQNILKKLRESKSTEELSDNYYSLFCIAKMLLSLGQRFDASEMNSDIQICEMLDAICMNPSNPKFSHALFECIGATILECRSGRLDQLSEQLFSIFQKIFKHEILEFIPYSFQIISVITRKSEKIPDYVLQLVIPCLDSTLWEQRGNVPSLIMFWRALLENQPSLITDQNALEPLLGVFQKLVSSKSMDIHGFDLLEILFINTKLESISPYLTRISSILLSRLQNSRTEIFLQRYVLFIVKLSANEKFGPKFSFHFVNNIQEKLFLQILNLFILPTFPKFADKGDRKTVLVGVTNLLKYLENVGPWEQIGQIYSSMLSALLDFSENSQVVFDDTSENATDETDIEYQSIFYRLHSVPSPKIDFSSSISNGRDYFFAEMKNEANRKSALFRDSMSIINAKERSILEAMGISN